MSKEAMAAKGFGSVMASRQEREDFVYLAKLDEQAERYDEMVGAMKKVVNLGVDLTAEERNLLSVGYKNVVGARRAGEEAKGYENRVRNIKEYRQKVEFSSICTEIFGLIDELLIPSASAVESSVFYYNIIQSWK